MQYTIDSQGIHYTVEDPDAYRVEDNEADEVARLLERRRLLAAEPTMPEIPTDEAVEVCKRISAQYAESDCECQWIGVTKCGMCDS